MKSWKIGIAVAGIFGLAMSAGNTREVLTRQLTYTGPSPLRALSADAKRAIVSSQASSINQMADKFQSEAASHFRGNFDALEWRLGLGVRLFYQSEDALTAGLAASDMNAMNAKMAGMALAKHGGGSENTINLLTNPCRIVDTGALRRWRTARSLPAVLVCLQHAGSHCGAGWQCYWVRHVSLGRNLPGLCHGLVPPGAPLAGGAGFLTLQHDSGTPTTSTMNYHSGINVAKFLRGGLV